MMDILQMSLQGALIIAVVVVIRALLMGRLPKWTFQVLWCVALIRLLIPFTVESPLSVYGAIEGMASPRQAIEQPVDVGAGAQAAPAEAEGPPVWPVAWAAVAGAMAAYFLVTHRRARRVFDQALPLYHVPIGVRRAAVRVSDRIDGPLTYGIARPVVLLPKRLGVHAIERDYVLAHELTHVRNYDSLKKFLLLAALCVHWFNPMVWVMFVLAGRDIEILCDESVVRTFGDQAKASYATMLIDFMEQRSAPVPLTSHFSKNATEERIIAIMKYKKTSVAAIVLSIALVLATSAAFATSAVTQNIVPAIPTDGVLSIVRVRDMTAASAVSQPALTSIALQPTAAPAPAQEGEYAIEVNAYGASPTYQTTARYAQAVPATTAYYIEEWSEQEAPTQLLYEVVAYDEPVEITASYFIPAVEAVQMAEYVLVSDEDGESLGHG